MGTTTITSGKSTRRSGNHRIVLAAVVPSMSVCRWVLVAVVAVVSGVVLDARGVESFSLPPPPSPRSYDAAARPAGRRQQPPPPVAGWHCCGHRSSSVLAGSANDDGNDQLDAASPSEPSSSTFSNYDDSDGAVSKGIVGSLTGLVNTAASTARSSSAAANAASLSSAAAPPKTPEELLDRIRKDYTKRNYLWTGDLDLACFFEDCRFTDPTISFVGTDTFTENTQNLVPIVEACAEDYRSDLLSIALGRSSDNAPNGGGKDGEDAVYVETRWNMVGSLTASPWLFWKPKIDVIGRTRFWFRRDGSSGSSNDDDNNVGDGGGYRVYFYDESWEIPAWKALLQIVTPAGTVSGTTAP